MAFIKLINHNELVENELSETLENLELHVDQNKSYVNMLMAKAKESTSVKGHRYVFSDIHNDPDGEYFVEQLRKYLNKDTYEMRV